MPTKKLCCLLILMIAIKETVSQQDEQEIITDSNCTLNKYRIPVSVRHIRTIYQFSCLTTDVTDPQLPTIGTSMPYEFNEMDLSRNVFTVLPFEQLCLYKYIYLLNISSNYIQNLTGAFVHLRCLSSVTSIDLSNNLITTPIIASDFDEFFASRLQSLNLEQNRIELIQTTTFIKKDGTSRFPNLFYLNLAKNKIKKLDLLWPLSLPSPQLFIDLKLNPIEELVNQMGLSFKSPSFIHDMVGNRYLDATTNKLQYLDDSNLMQYGLQDARDFRQFMNKLSNYDFRQSNYMRTFICFCPTGGQYTVEWFKNVSSSLDLNCPIFQLFCSNFQLPVYILNYPCEQTVPETTVPMPAKIEINKNFENLLVFNNDLKEIKTTAPKVTTTLQSTQAVSTTIKSGNFLIRLGLNQFTASVIKSTTNDSVFNSNSNYAYLLILIIPILLILIVLFVCLCGRRFQIFIHDTYSVILCPCFRPPDSSLNTNKIYDLTICFNEYDDTWLNEQFMPQLSQFDNGYKIHKLSLYHRLNFHLSETSKRVLISSKRIVLILSEKFLNEEWSNKIFHDFIKNIYANDQTCIIVPINLGDVSELKITTLLSEFDIEQRLSSFKLKSQIKYSLGLIGAEYLNWTDGNFWKQFNYIMPYRDNDQITKISHSSKEKRLIPKYINQSFETKNTIKSVTSLSASPANKFNSIRNSKKRSRKVSESRAFEFSNTRNSADDTDSSKKLSTVRHIIVPIPNEMRTQLGTGSKQSKMYDLQTESMNHVKTTTETEIDSNKRNRIFLTSNSKSIEPSLVPAQQERLFSKPVKLNAIKNPSPSENVLSIETANMFERQPSSKRTRLGLQPEVTSSINNNIKSIEAAGSLMNNFAIRQTNSSFVRKSRRRRQSKSDTNSLNEEIIR